MRGLFFLILVSIVTYFGKIRPIPKNIISSHGLVGWVFKQEGRLSVLVVMPNDGDYQNQTENGERIFINPLENPMQMDSNHIRYQKKDLYLFGDLRENHVKNYCSQVDSTSLLYFSGPLEWTKTCERSSVMQGEANRFLQDWGVQSKLKFGPDSQNFELQLIHKKQLFRFTSGGPVLPNDSSLLWIETEPGVSQDSSLAKLCLNSEKTFKQGESDSNLVISQIGQTLGFKLDEDGSFFIQKLWLSDGI